MSEDFHQNIWSKNLDFSFDGLFDTLFKNGTSLTGLAWFPWVGKDYSKTPYRILIVGESHYAKDIDKEKAADKLAKLSANKYETREIVAEYPIEGSWERNNPTFDNLHRSLLKTDLLNPCDKEKRGLLWRQIGYYNLVQRPMDYGRRERPNPDDFMNGWLVFSQLVKVIRPKTCVFIGVEASNYFNHAMEDMGIEHTPIQWGEYINGVYKRIGGSVTIDGITTNLIFMRHASQYFSWDLWSTFLCEHMPEGMAYLRRVVLNDDLSKQAEYVAPKEFITNDRKHTGGIPTYLAHKPIIACKYGVGFGDDSEDARYLSVGRAQYNQECASVKIFRHTGERWSRQSEEVPINRLGYLMQLFLSAIKIVQSKKAPPQTSLHEEIVSPDELEFLRAEIHEHRDEITHSLKEIKTLLADIDFEKL
jgi:hypothetical protein